MSILVCNVAKMEGFLKCYSKWNMHLSLGFKWLIKSKGKFMSDTAMQSYITPDAQKIRNGQGAWIAAVKVKSIPLQPSTGPEGSRKLKFPDFVTATQDGGKIVSLTHRLRLPPGNTPDTHFC